MKPAQVASYAQRLMEAGWLFAAVLTPLYFDIFSNRVFEPDKATLLRIIALVMGLAWMVHQMELGSPTPWREPLRAFWRATPLTPWVVGLVGILALTTITSVNPLASLWGSYHRLQGLLTYLSYLVVFFLVVHHLKRWAQTQRLISVILVTSLPVAAYGIVQHWGYDPIPWGADVTQRVTSSQGNPIFLAAYLIMVVPLTLARLIDAWTRQPRPWVGVSTYGVLLAIQLVAILFTQSRGPWLGLGAALALGAILLAWRWGRRRLAWGMGLAAVAAASFIILLNLPGSPVSSLRGASPYLERLSTILDLESGTNKVRLLIWFGDEVGRGAWGLVTDDPLRTVIGHGPESMFVAFNPYYPPTLIDYEARGAIPDRSHNDYLDYVVTSGLLGLAAYLGVVAVFFRATWRHLWQTSDRGHQLLVLSLMAGVVAHLVETFFGIAIVATRTHFWLFLGMAMSLMAMPGEETATGRTRASPRRRDRPQRQRGRGEPAAGSRLRGLPILIYLAFWVIFLGLSLRPEVGQVVLARPPLVGLATLFWLLLGMLLVAWWLEAPPLSLSRQDRPSTRLRQAQPGGSGQRPSTRLRQAQPGGSGQRPPRRWLYLPLIAASAYLLYLLIGVVVADIYFKAGQEYDRAGQYQRTYSLYLGAVSWGIPQDIYFSFLGGYYIRMAQQTGSSRPPEGGAGPPIEIETVSDLFSPALSQPWLLGQEELLVAGRVALTAAQRANPLNPDNGQNLGRFYALWGSLAPDDETRSERFGQANAYYEEATRMRPTTSALFAEWGYALFVAEAEAEAEAKLNRALELEPSYAPAWALLGELRLDQGRPQEAASFFRKTAEVMAALGIDSMPVLWGKTYKIEELLRQAEALEASPS